MGFKIIAMQPHNMSPNIMFKKGLRSKLSISVGHLMISLKYRLKIRVKFTHLKD